MKLYFIRVYCLNATGLILSLMTLLLLVGPGIEMLPQAILISALFSAWFTHRDFRRRQIWALYDNLGIARMPLLLAPTVGLVIVALVLRVWI